MPNLDPGQYRDPVFLRLAAGFTYFFFGCLKFFPDLSPAELIAGQSIMVVTGHWLDAQTALWWLSIVECVIGLSFIFNIGLHYIFFVFMLHQASTFLPLFIFPEYTFKFIPFAPTIEGQYILKNLISMAAGWTVLFPAVKAAWGKPKEHKLKPPADQTPARSHRKVNHAAVVTSNS
jgi:hypothetical protein